MEKHTHTHTFRNTYVFGVERINMYGGDMEQHSFECR